MRPFAELTDTGQVRRLRRLATTALGRYPIVVRRLRLLATDTNTIFRIDTADGRRLALRVGTAPDTIVTDIALETAWLEALADSGIEVVGIVPSNDGARFVEVEDPDVDGVRRCAVFTWVPGRTPGSGATATDYRHLGELSARLHDHGTHWSPPAGTLGVAWDRVFYAPDDPVVMYDQRFRGLMTPERTRVVRVVEARCGEELERTYRGGRPIVVHGDLHPWNVHRHRGRLIAFDFEDVMWATPVQDIAISLYYNRDRPDHTDLVAAFRDGYTIHRPWPVEHDRQLELLWAARTILFINYVLRTGDHPDDHVPRMTARIANLAAG